MLAFIVVLSLVTGGLTSVLCPVKVDLQRTVHLPHPTSCSKFLTCVGNHPVEQDCPEGLHWNVERSYCDYPWASECSRGNGSDPLEPQSFNSTAVANSVCLPQTNRCPLNPNPSETVVFLKHQDCRKFYACVSTHQVELSCPPNLYWNSLGCVCDYEVEAECEENYRQEDDGPVEIEEVQNEAEISEGSAVPDWVPDWDQNGEATAKDQEPAVAARVRRAADEEGSTTASSASTTTASAATESTAASVTSTTASSAPSTTASSVATTSASGSGSGGSGSGGSGSGGSVESGADVRTVSSIAVVAFTVLMGML